jgi:hypothetical protein
MYSYWDIETLELELEVRTLEDGQLELEWYR